MYKFKDGEKLNKKIEITEERLDNLRKSVLEQVNEQGLVPEGERELPIRRGVLNMLILSGEIDMNESDIEKAIKKFDKKGAAKNKKQKRAIVLHKLAQGEVDGLYDYLLEEVK